MKGKAWLILSFIERSGNALKHKNEAHGTKQNHNKNIWDLNSSGT